MPGARDYHGPGTCHLDLHGLTSQTIFLVISPEAEEERRKAEEERLRAAEERRRAASRADKFTPAFASALDPGSLSGHKISVVGIGKNGASMVGTVVSFKKGLVFGMGASKHKVDFGGKIKRALLLHDGTGGKEFSLFDDARFAARFGAKVTKQSPMHTV